MNREWKRKQSAKRHYAARRAKLIRDALKRTIDVNQIVESVMHSHFTPNVTTEELRTWTKLHVVIDGTPLLSALSTLYAESYVLGQDIAMNSIAKARINKAPTKQQLQRAVGIDWSKWKPGNRAAANLLKPPNGLRNLLDKRGVTIQGVNRTSLDRIGTAIARVLQKGETPQGAVPVIMEEIAGIS